MELSLVERGERVATVPIGTVYGALLNDRGALAALGDAVHAPPYHKPPRASVLYVKPANTHAGDGAGVGLVAGRAARAKAGAPPRGVGVAPPPPIPPRRSETPGRCAANARSRPFPRRRGERPPAYSRHSGRRDPAMQCRSSTAWPTFAKPHESASRKPVMPDRAPRRSIDFRLQRAFDRVPKQVRQRHRLAERVVDPHAARGAPRVHALGVVRAGQLERRVEAAAPRLRG